MIGIVESYTEREKLVATYFSELESFQLYFLYIKYLKECIEKLVVLSETGRIRTWKCDILNILDLDSGTVYWLLKVYSL